MSNIVVLLKSGEKREFIHEGRAGGSYTKTIRYEGGFAIIKNEYGRETAIPADSIAEITVTPNR